MEIPTRELVNTLFSSSITAFQTSQMAHIPSTMDMDIDSNIVRGRSASSSRNSSRESSILSKASSMTYHECMEVMNTLMSEDIWKPVDMLQLSYMSINRDVEEGKLVSCHMQVHLSDKLHPHSDVTSKKYKSAFHGGHLSHNTSYGSVATLRIFCLPQWEYPYSTWSSMTELLLSVSQH